MEQNEKTAAMLRAIADALLVPVAKVTGLPPATVQGFVEGTTTGAVDAAKAPKKRKASAYSRAYKRAFKRVAPEFKLKNGNWKKNGFKRAVNKAHATAKKEMRK